jgi:hypothetical protein
MLNVNFVRHLLYTISALNDRSDINGNHGRLEASAKTGCKISAISREVFKASGKNAFVFFTQIHNK